MGASSVTGSGAGSAGTVTSKDLAILANGPTIIFTGIAEGEENVSSPPNPAANTVVFPYALEGSADAYVVILTTINGGYAYITDRDEADGYFTGFSFACEADGSVMYLVAKVGMKPQI
jgi:hypothetical protein